MLSYYADKEKLIADTAAEMRLQNPSDIAKKAASLVLELAGAKREIEALNAKIAASKLESVFAGAKTVGACRLVTAKFDGMAIDVARSMGDEIKANNPDTVAVLAVNANGRLNFISVAGAEAVRAGAHAGRIVSAVAAVTGGKGGGRPDSAMAGGVDASKIDAALEASEAVLSGMLK